MNNDEIIDNEEALSMLQNILQICLECGSDANAKRDKIFETFGFQIVCSKSSIQNGGQGVFVEKGFIPKNVIVAIYPGLIYRPAEPIFFQSLNNPFIFRCLDGTLIDGNNRGLSKYLYRSCAYRDRVGPYLSADISWLTEQLENPLAVGQIVNNQSKKYSANVAYQEIDIPQDFPFHLRRFLPNNFYTASISDTDSQRLLRTVLLISLRDVYIGEEIFSNYFTLVSETQHAE